MRKRALDDVLELEIAVGQDEGAFDWSVEILDTMASEMDPVTLSHFFQHMFYRPNSIDCFDELESSRFA